MREPENSEPLLRFENVSKRFGGVQALRGVSFDLRAGEVHALLGQNGAGKSTLVKILSGVHSKDAGHLFINGTEINLRNPSAAREAGIAMVYQELSLVPTLSVADNMFLGRQSGTGLELIDRRAEADLVRPLLARCGLNIDPRTLVSDLPFGCRQVVEIAKALRVGARILVLDEPTSSLTSSEENDLFNLLALLKSQGVGIVYITHRLSEVFRVADRVTVLRDGANAGSFATCNLTSDQLISAIVGTSSSLGRATSQPTGEVNALSTAPRDGPPRLELKGITTDKLHAIDLDVWPGEVVGLAGMMGSGRTEIAEAVFGIDPLRAGEIRIDGAKVSIRSTGDAVKHGIALVPEDRHAKGLVLELSVEHNLLLPRLGEFVAALGLMRQKACSSYAADLVSRLHIATDSIHREVAALSGGNQQKVVIGKWLGALPRVLILDEPTAGVDIGSKQQVSSIVRDLAKEGVAVIAISSELSELLVWCDRIVVVAEGRIVRSCSRQQIDGEDQLHRMVQQVSTR